MTSTDDGKLGARVLVVDDEPEIADMLVDILAPHGYAVETAPDGETALTKMIDGDFDAVLSDLIRSPLD